MFKIEDALVEIQQKSLNDIQKETAYKWASRACAAYILNDKFRAHEFAHEAIEHAALHSDEVLADIRKTLKDYDEGALNG